MNKIRRRIIQKHWFFFRLRRHQLALFDQFPTGIRYRAWLAAGGSRETTLTEAEQSVDKRDILNFGNMAWVPEVVLSAAIDNKVAQSHVFFLDESGYLDESGKPVYVATPAGRAPKEPT